jgi:hypothetical protein
MPCCTNSTTDSAKRGSVSVGEAYRKTPAFTRGAAAPARLTKHAAATAAANTTLGWIIVVTL